MARSAQTAHNHSCTNAGVMRVVLANQQLLCKQSQLDLRADLGVRLWHWQVHVQ